MREIRNASVRERASMIRVMYISCTRRVSTVALMGVMVEWTITITLEPSFRSTRRT